MPVDINAIVRGASLMADLKITIRCYGAEGNEPATTSAEWVARIKRDVATMTKSGPEFLGAAAFGAHNYGGAMDTENPY